MRILIEASGSFVSAYLIKAIQDAGHQAIASDINTDCAANYLADDFVCMPKSSDPSLWEKVSHILVDHSIDLVIPSFDDTLLGWAQGLHNKNDSCTAQVLLSSADVVEIFLDKWKAYNFFLANNIPTPLTSLNQDYSLVKPRRGRGGKGIYYPSTPVDMSESISQEIAVGDEYTVDVFCDNSHNPIYIVPRKRLHICDGKSTQGVVVEHPAIVKLVYSLCAATSFRGPINIQCFSDSDGSVSIIEVNPRVAGGMALGFAATENWVPLMVAMSAGQTNFEPVPVKYGLQMFRYYAEVFG